MLEINSLNPTDVDDALDLSTQAGWNQIATDWERLLALNPEGCFGGYIDGELIATSCVVTYEDGSNWIGMVLVDENHRGQGYGTALFERALDYTDGIGGPVGLDATEYGAPLYRKHGFHNTMAVERWSGTLEPVQTEYETVVLQPSQIETLPSLDIETIGIDRSNFLDRLLSEIGVIALGICDGDEVIAYAIVRPGRNHPQFGPAVAPDISHFAALLEETRSLLSDPTIILDVLPDNETIEVLRRHGLTRQRELTRMVRGPRTDLLADDGARAIAGFAWG
ncbi:GNAT family N-acetyltransferase [Haladaptatus sp. DFWS20]|uniref:GNAT family N-acetyltransferase n=1 Tax=Haladaptatus sp. DFWS20 TaxID=3403467 RepID=UPI003EB7BC2A